MREIGSEFWDVPICGKDTKIFPQNIRWYISGRSALQAIIKENPSIKSVAMPAWCCDSMIKPFLYAGMEVIFYPVYFDRELVQEISFDSDVLFLMDYFGYSASTPDLSSYKGIVIRDVTHSIFSSSYTDADYYFGSLRKWCGIWTGGYAWTADGHELPMEHSDDYGYAFLRQRAMELKNSYINGYVDRKGNTVTDKGYLKVFEAAEECLEKVGIGPAEYRDMCMANDLDVEFIKTRRRENAKVLREAFHGWLIFPEMKDTDCPMFVPILVPNGKRDALRRYLISNEIYCPIHWSVSEYHRHDERTEKIYKNELSLVCDQRYTAEDMHKVVETIKLFMEG